MELLRPRPEEPQSSRQRFLTKRYHRPTNTPTKQWRQREREKGQVLTVRPLRRTRKSEREKKILSVSNRLTRQPGENVAKREGDICVGQLKNTLRNVQAEGDKRGNSLIKVYDDTRDFSWIDDEKSELHSKRDAYLRHQDCWTSSFVRIRGCMFFFPSSSFPPWKTEKKKKVTAGWSDHFLRRWSG